MGQKSIRVPSIGILLCWINPDQRFLNTLERRSMLHIHCLRRLNLLTRVRFILQIPSKLWSWHIRLLSTQIWDRAAYQQGSLEVVPGQETYVRRTSGDTEEKDIHRDNFKHQKKPELPPRVFHVILDRLAAGETSHSERKKNACFINNADASRKKFCGDEHIIFSKEDMKGVGFSQFDDIIITVNVEMWKYEDSSLIMGGLAIYCRWMRFQMEIDIKNLKLCIWGLISFTSHMAPIIGCITLPPILENGQGRPSSRLNSWSVTCQ